MQVARSFVRAGRRRRIMEAASVLLAGAVLLWLAFRGAWVGEDVFITFRSIDQLLAGNGFRWNPDERVQSYTHPLWALLNVPVHAWVRDVATAATLTGFAATAAAWAVLAGHFRRRPLVVWAGLLLPLCLSHSFVLYSSSGFENPLSHLCWAAFAVAFLRGLEDAAPRWGVLALCASAGVLSRPDVALVYVPPLLWLGIRHRRDAAWGRLALGVSPLAAWLAFATFYYGFPYPNTAPAKINPEIDSGLLLRQGLYYALDLWHRDPWGFLWLVLGALASVRLAWSADPRRRGVGMLGLGGPVYALYVIRLGGDFLSGRHWTLSILVAVGVLAAALDDAVAGFRSGRLRLPPRSLRGFAPPLGALAAAAAVAIGAGRVDPARLPDYREVLPLPAGHQRLGPDGHWHTSAMGRLWQWNGAQLGERAVVRRLTVGMSGVAAGPDVVIIDQCGLTDPLLARLPPQLPWDGKVGHYFRAVPEGYEHARRTGSLDRMHPELAAYYRPLREIVAGPLFRLGRLREIVAFNLGAYDGHRDAYLAARREHLERLREALEERARQDARWAPPR